MTELLARDVTSAASAVTATGDVHVNFTVMTETERRGLAERFLADSAPIGYNSGRGSVRGRQRERRGRQIQCRGQRGRRPRKAG